MLDITNKRSSPYHLIDIRAGFKPLLNMAVFLDRDGVINEERHLVRELHDFVMIPRSAAAIDRLNKAGIPVLVVHNAAAVCRNLCSLSRVIELNEKMKELLAVEEAYVDAILFCPHHPEAFNAAFAHECPWRKPGTGMLEFLGSLFCLDLKKSYLVGDSYRDITMGQTVGSKTIALRTGHAVSDGRTSRPADHWAKDLWEAVDIILKEVL